MLKTSHLLKFALVLFVAAVAAVAYVTSAETAPQRVEDREITINAKGVGNPHVNFDDGKAISLPEGASGGSSLKTIGSGDVDSDGVPDLIAVDISGRIVVFKGNIDTIFPYTHDAKRRRAENANTDEPFFFLHRGSSFPIAPDEIAVGDFSADGLLDIVAIEYGDNRIYIATGGGNGHFSHPVAYPLDGSITAFASGEIGRADGQMDLAVAFSNKNGNFIAVFENPGGAFEKAPELTKVPAPVSTLTVGHLDTDFYGDIAATSGNKLTIIRGRGQVSTWERLYDHQIGRPAPIIETRTLPFSIVATTCGSFNGERGDDLALLSSDGAIYTLSSLPAQVTTEDISAFYPKGERQTDPRRRGEGEFSKYSIFEERVSTSPTDPLRPELHRYVAGELVPLTSNESPSSGETSDLSIEESLSSDIAEGSRMRTKQNFLRSISPKRTRPLAEWPLRAVARDPNLLLVATSSAAGPLSMKFQTVRISDSGLDEIAMLDRNNGRILVFVQGDNNYGSPLNKGQLLTLNSQGPPTGILPMRLNADALSDLVVLREGSNSPDVVLTAPMATFVVTSSADEDRGGCGPDCTLREAIIAANLSPGVDTITFNIPSSAPVIQPIIELPTITSAVTIDATSQPGWSGSPVIEINGDLANDGDNGLNINASNSVVRGLVINRFRQVPPTEEEPGYGGHGISIFNFAGQTGAQFNLIEANYLGTDRTGTIDYGNEIAGLQIFDSDNNFVGGTVSVQRNVMSGNGNGELPNGDRFGFGLIITAGNSNTIRGNYFGLNAGGTAPLPNSTGMRITGKNNVIGGDAAGSTNVASGNRHNRLQTPTSQGWCNGRGISDDSLVSLEPFEWQTELNSYRGNRVGTNASGTAAVSNCDTGLRTSPRNSAFIGSVTTSGRNVVSGNTNGGIICSHRDPFEFYPNLVSAPRVPTNIDLGEEPPIPEGSCTIGGNNVGTNATGNFAIPNNHDAIVPVTGGGGFFALNIWGGIGVFNTNTYSEIGGDVGASASSCAGFCNLASGNRGSNPSAIIPFNIPGIARRSLDGEVSIFKNYVGTNVTGTVDVGNQMGVLFTGATLVGEVANPGTSPTSLGNLISGNTSSSAFAGHAIEGGTLTGPLVIQIIRGNLIGTDRTGLAAIPNQQGVAIHGSSGATVIGGEQIAARNIISGNTGFGLSLGDVPTTPIINNYIGVNANGNALGNGGNGIVLRGSFDFIGDNNIGNTIAHNGGNGILVLYSGGGGYSVSNRIRFNSIFNNGKLGIDLSGDLTAPHEEDGITPNDCEDPDDGSNRLQNYPVLTAPIFNGDGTVTVGGAFDSTPLTTFVIDFYSNSSADPSNYGEGELHIGSTNVTTSVNGRTSILFTSTVPVGAGARITATATDPNGNTSEFSCFAGECSLTGGLTEDQSVELILGSGCQIGFVVNINTDESDPNPSDGICDVDLSTPGEQCSLRAAIETTNAIAGTDFITFDIPGGGVKTISTTNDLPPITDRVTIDATSQPGYSGTPVIEIEGNGTQNYCLGLAAGSAGSSIIGFALNRCVTGVLVTSEGNRITRSYIGLRPDGTAAGEITVQQVGIALAAGQNRVGGTTSTGNLISNNVAGIAIENSDGNELFGNRIGVSPDGGAAIPNSIGILVRTSNSNSIGDGSGNHANIIAGNLGAELVLETDADRNDIAGNLIGVSFNGVGQSVTFDRTNGILLRTSAAENRISSNTIGGYKQTAQSAGILLDATAGELNEVNTNFIGVTPDMSQDIGATYGIVVFADRQKIVGNHIGYSTEAAIFMAAPPKSPNLEVSGNEIELNRVGVSLDGDTFPNAKFGIHLAGAANSNLIKRNVAGNNAFFGIGLTDGPTSNTIEENIVGLTVNGVSHSNGGGIWVRNASDNIVKRNAVSNNPIGILLGTNIGFGNTNQNIKSGYINLSADGAASQTTGNRVSGNVVRNSSIGIAVGDTSVGNFVAPDDGDFNVILGSSGSKYGVGILVGTLDEGTNPSALARQNTVQRNLIGFDPETQTANSNVIGMMVTGAVENLIGGATDVNANFIVASSQDGLIVSDRSADNTIRINKIGVTPNGQQIGNGGNGIVIENGASNTEIESGNEKPGLLKDGSSVPSGTVVTGSTMNGILVRTGALATKIIDVLIANNGDDGIRIEDSPGSIIGETVNGNIIVGNGENGLSVRGQSSTNTEIIGNFIGTSPNEPLLERRRARGSTLGNGGHGVLIVEAPNTRVGQVGGGNKIFDNGLDGVRVTDMNGSFPMNASLLVVGNDVSFNQGSGVVTTVAHETIHVMQGNVFEGNEIVGVDLADSNNNSVTQNLVKNNGQEGVVLAGNATRLNNVRGNIIAENVSHGVNIDNGANTNNIGGPNSGQGNTIRNNGGAGINLTPTAGTGNNLDPNVIFGNIGLGIDLGGDGFTINDPGDADIGPNNLQNYPTIMSARIISSELIVSFFMDSSPGNSNYGTQGIYVELFKADANGEGELFLGSTYYTEAEYNSLTPAVKTVNLGDITVLGFLPSDQVTSTATDADGNTSEFSPTLGPTAAGVTISGRVFTAAGTPLRGTTVTITDDSGVTRTAVTSSLGYYAFEGVQAGRTYVVNAVSRRYRFTPRIVNVADPISDLDLIALE